MGNSSLNKIWVAIVSERCHLKEGFMLCLYFLFFMLDLILITASIPAFQQKLKVIWR